MSLQMQRVHEEHGCETLMATLSRRLLPSAAILILLVAIGLNISTGGSVLTVAIFGFGLIMVVFSWYLFEATSRSNERGSSPIKAKHASGKTLDKFASSELDSELPDPLEAGFEIPLM